MAKISPEAEKVMAERFGEDRLIALATVGGGVPHVRNVNACYEDGAFYTITDARSGKMRHIAENPAVALAGDWFTAHGKASSLGYWKKEENQRIVKKLEASFTAWIRDEHGALNDENVILLRIELTDGHVFSEGTSYDF